MALNPKIIYGISRDGYVILGDSTYNYANDNNIIDLMIKYKKVQIDDGFNMPIDFLPNGITYLNIGRSFNYPIDNLPLTLKSLTIRPYRNIGYIEFNQPLDYLPHGLEYLYIGLNSYFDQELNHLPTTLKYLEINNVRIMKKIDINSFPDSIETIKIKTVYYDVINKLPENLKIFHMVGGDSSDWDDTDNVDQLNSETPEEKFINRFSDRNIDFKN